MNSQRLLSNIESLGRIGWEEGKGLYRTAFSEAFVKGRDFVADLMEKAGMKVRVDPVGNLFGRYENGNPHAPAILMGSHLDSVPGGGKYDGHLGVLSALEAAQSFHERGSTGYPVEVVGFNAEEGGEMGGTFGSRAVCGDIEELPAADVLRSLRLTPEGIASSRLDFSQYLAYLELHIEQGPVLWRKGIPIGIPTAIVGITRYRVTVEGQANHAGTTPMGERKDALKEAVNLLSRWYKWVEAVQEENFVCNVGSFALEPNAASIVPGKASFVLELRSTDDAIVEMLGKRFRDLLSQTALPAYMTPNISKPAVELDESLRYLIRESCRELGLESLDMPSGAGHDASPIAKHIPSGMIFLPSIDGISHSPAENTFAEDIIRGERVLEKILEKLNAIQPEFSKRI
jgi:hydantoinase/carbamoylase family amidase